MVLQVEKALIARLKRTSPKKENGDNQRSFGEAKPYLSSPTRG
jgi:hypothetical protein